MSDPKKKTLFKVPVTWEMSGYVEVEARSLSEAVDKFDAAKHSIPKVAEVVEDSFRLNLVALEDDAFDDGAEEGTEDSGELEESEEKK